MHELTLEYRDHVAYIHGPGVPLRVATLVEERLWKQLDPQVQFKDRLTAPYSRLGATICDKHDYLLTELRRISAKPQLVALRETLFRMEQVCRAAMRDGQSLEKGLQRRGEECNNIEAAASEFAAGVKPVLEQALRTAEARRAELLISASEVGRGRSQSEVLALATAAEAMDREAAQLRRAIENANPFILEKATT